MIVLFAAVALATASPADALSGLEAAFANTVVSTYPDGRRARLWLKRDGAYTASGRRGKLSSGTWKLNSGKVCLRQRRPVPAPLVYCSAYKAGGVGTRWSGRAVTGEPIRIELVAGR